MISIRNILLIKGSPARQLVTRDGVAIGLLEKFRNTASETHPWKAFFYVVPPGPKVQIAYLGAFYRAEGGKRAAIQAIIKRATV